MQSIIVRHRKQTKRTNQSTVQPLAHAGEVLTLPCTIEQGSLGKKYRRISGLPDGWQFSTAIPSMHGVGYGEGWIEVDLDKIETIAPAVVRDELLGKKHRYYIEALHE